MKRKLLFLICLALGLAALPIHAQDYEDCQSSEATEDYNVVVEACTALLDVDPMNSDAYFSRAYAQNELGNYEEAIIDYSKVLFIYPKDEYAFNNRGFAYAQLGQFEEAVVDYTRALLVNPSYTLALINRAYAYVDLGDLQSAIDDTQRLAELEPENYYAYDLLGSIFIEQGAFGDAIDAYTSYIELAPEDANGYLGRGFAYWTLGEFEQAAPDYLTWVNMTAPNMEEIDPAEAVEPFTVTLEEGTHFMLEIEGEEGQTLTATAAARQGTVDPLLILIDPDDNPIMMDDDSGGGFGELDATIEDFELPEDGTYTLIIGYAGGGSEGDVRVDVRLSE
jgi:tetratricopeptide (TPR) repeat protein